MQGDAGQREELPDRPRQRPGLHHHAVWTSRRGRLHNGLQIPNVRIAGEKKHFGTFDN